jgi:TolB-like protein/lipoprotein NlpI
MPWLEGHVVDSIIPAYAGDEPYVFVSYAHSDGVFVMDQIRWLHSQGVPVWYDEGISPGLNWPEELANAIEAAAIVLLFVSPRSVVSEHCVRETTFAISRRKPLLAVHIEPTELPAGLELSIADKQAIMHSTLGVDAYETKLLSALSGYLGGGANKTAPSPRAAAYVASAGKPAVAVLPFKLRSRNPKDDYLSVALADALITFLGGNEQLAVRPWSAVERYTSPSVDPLAAARELNVRHVIEGSLQKIDTRIRVHTKLWTNGEPGLSHTQDGDMNNLFELQDELAERIASALGLGESLEREQPPTHNPAAYQLYLQGVDRLTRLNRWDTRTGVEMLKQVVRLDPDFSEAWGRLAASSLEMALSFEPADPQWYELAEDAIHKTLELEPTNNYAHFAHGRLLWSPAKGYQNRPALRALGRALKIQPGMIHARIWHALILTHVGLLDEAVANLGTALELAPDDPLTHFGLGHAAMYAGDMEASIVHHERSLMLEPNHQYTNLFFALMWAYAEDLPRANQALAAARQLIGEDPMLTSTEAVIHASAGEAEAARVTITRALEQLESHGSPVHTHHIFHGAAAVYAKIGMTAEALAMIDKTINSGLPNYPMFRGDPHFADIREEPAFQSMLSGLQRDWTDYHREFG